MAESFAIKQAESEEPSLEATATLASLFLGVERHHQRSAVVERRLTGRTERTPDWRFHRHIMRIALYLRERCSLEAGDCVALVANLRPEWLIFDWATVLQGATTLVVPPGMSAQLFSTACTVWRAAAPRVVLVGDAADLARARALGAEGGAPERVITLEQENADASLVSYAEALDLGGTLDTAERANAMRARARTIKTGQVAATYAATGESRSHGEIASRASRLDARAAPRRGGAGSEPATERLVRVDGAAALTPDLHCALYGYVADGSTCVAFAGHERDRQEVRP